MTDEGVRNAGFDDWLDALGDGEGYYLACPDGHGSLPPRRACPRCGAVDLRTVTLPATGTVETHTVVHIPTPQFEEDAPYVTAIAAFGAIRLTGILRGIDPEAVEAGLPVGVGVERTRTRGDRAVVFRQA